MAHHLLEPRAEAVTTNYSQAFSLQPSRVWDGNDGAWSTFVIRVGNPPQYFRIVPSTLGTETWVPIPDKCEEGTSWCGNARGVEPFNSGTSGPASGSPTGAKLGSLDAGKTCTANRSPNCVSCVSVNGHCTNGPCAGRTCCGDPPGQCNSGGCNGVSGICTGEYIGCPCPGPDYDAGTGDATTSPSVGASGPLLAQGFGYNTSTSWAAKGDHEVGLEKYLNQSATGQYGLDTVGIGAYAATGLTVEESVVAGVPTLPFYLGKLGLKPSNNSGPNKDTMSLMSKLLDQKMIPSLSYGYTAGALYKQQPPLGSLTLGGFDMTRMVPNEMTFYIDDTSNLFVPIQSISAVQTLQSDSSLAKKNFTAIVDTTTPHTWLPLEACKAFERAFGLKWDDENDLYLVNDTAHQRLLNQNPQVTFTLGPTPDKVLNITLPYAAFDLQASQPFFDDGTNYFPIRRATNPTQYTLGRAFFQEAYLIVDYETKNFSISQTAYPVPPESKIITINHHVAPAGPPTDPDPVTPPLSSSTIAGVTVGAAVGLIALAVLAYFIIRRLPICLSRQRPSLRASSSSFFSSRPSLREKADIWPSNSQLNSPNSQGGTLVGFPQDSNQTSQSPTELKGCIPQELSNTRKSSPQIGFYGASSQSRSNTPRTNDSKNSFGGRKSTLSREESLSKPLPRTPVELMGSDPAAELVRSSVGSKGRHGRPPGLPDLSEEKKWGEHPYEREAMHKAWRDKQDEDRLPRGKHAAPLAANHEVDSPVLKGMGLGIATSTPEDKPLDRHNYDGRGMRSEGPGSAAHSRQASVRTTRSGKPTGLRSRSHSQHSQNRNWQVSPCDDDEGDRILVGLGRSDSHIISPVPDSRIGSTVGSAPSSEQAISPTSEDELTALPPMPDLKPSSSKRKNRGRDFGRSGRGTILPSLSTSSSSSTSQPRQPRQPHPPPPPEPPHQPHHHHRPRDFNHPTTAARERSRSRPRTRNDNRISRSRSRSLGRRKSSRQSHSSRNNSHPSHPRPRDRSRDKDRDPESARSGSLSSARSYRSRATDGSIGSASADLRKVEWRAQGGFGRRSGSAGRNGIGGGFLFDSGSDTGSPIGGGGGGGSAGTSPVNGTVGSLPPSQASSQQTIQQAASRGMQGSIHPAAYPRRGQSRGGGHSRSESGNGSEVEAERERERRRVRHIYEMMA